MASGVLFFTGNPIEGQPIQDSDSSNNPISEKNFSTQYSAQSVSVDLNYH